jgi:hypothetical protein
LEAIAMSSSSSKAAKTPKVAKSRKAAKKSKAAKAVVEAPAKETTAPVVRPLYYFTIEDEGILAEAFEKLDEETYAITYKLKGSKEVFVTTAGTREALDLHDVPYNLLAEEESSKIGVYHTEMSKEELGEYEDGIRALFVANGAIAGACVGVNGDPDLGFDLSKGASQHSYFTAPAGHTFIFRMFFDREDAGEFLFKFTAEDPAAVEWAEGLPLESSEELQTFS